MRLVTLSCLYFAVVVGCSASPRIQFTSGSGASGSGSGGAGTSAGMSSSSSDAGGLGGSIGLGGGLAAGGGGSTGTGCSQATQLVYVFGIDNNIYSFDPPSKQFTMVATPDCQTSGTPNSMAIDRNLVAWLNYLDGTIQTFDLKTKIGCQLAVTLPTGFTQVGMGFSTDTVGGTAETLYVDGIGGGGLARIDMATKTLVKIGAFANDVALQGQSAELTGTGDAKLYGYFTTSPYVRVAQLDKSNAGILSDKVLTGVGPPSDWAFTFWGGDFYLYAAPGKNSTGNSSVIRYSPATDTVDPTYVADVGFAIIGAGVSTCAPIKPPS